MRRRDGEAARHVGPSRASACAPPPSRAVARDAACAVGRAPADRRLRRGRGGRRRVRGLARADLGCGPHGHRRGVVRRRAHRRGRDRAAAVGAGVLRLCARRGAGRVRQRARDARPHRLDRGRGGRAPPRTGAGGRADGDVRRRWRDLPSTSSWRSCCRASSGGINARGALLHVDGRPPGLGGGARRRRRRLLDRVDADRSDPVARRRAPDPALDARAAQGVDRRAARRRAGPRVLRRRRPRARGAARRDRRARPARLADERRARRAVGAPDALRRAVLAAGARRGATDARARLRHRSRDAAARVAGRAAGRPGDSRGRRRRTSTRTGSPAADCTEQSCARRR